MAFDKRGCGIKLGRLGVSSSIHTKTAFALLGSTSNWRNALERPFGNWRQHIRTFNRQTWVSVFWRELLSVLAVL